MAKPTTAPTAEELLCHSVVQGALDDAWGDSLPDDSELRHEEGGWIYLNIITGEITVRRSRGGLAGSPGFPME